VILLQRNQMVLADLGDRGNVFQRDAAGQPLHAQVFSEASHGQLENRDVTPTVFHFHNKPGSGFQSKRFVGFAFIFMGLRHLNQTSNCLISIYCLREGI
jgi:hypothetical protein